MLQVMPLGSNPVFRSNDKGPALGTRALFFRLQVALGPQLALSLLWFGGHRSKGGYGVDHGRGEDAEAAAAELHRRLQGGSRAARSSVEWFSGALRLAAFEQRHLRTGMAVLPSTASH